MYRPWLIAIVFGLCLAVLLAAMGWISMEVLRLDRAQADAHRQALKEENVRLALWRMESALGPIVAQESAQPYFAYTSFYPVERAYTRMFSQLAKGDVVLPSPLLVENSPYILLHFQFGPKGELTSPQVPSGPMWSKAESGPTSRAAIESSATRLAKLKSLLRMPDLASVLPRDDGNSPLPALAFANDFNYNGNNDKNSLAIANTALPTPTGGQPEAVNRSGQAALAPRANTSDIANRVGQGAQRNFAQNLANQDNGGYQQYYIPNNPPTLQDVGQNGGRQNPANADAAQSRQNGTPQPAANNSLAAAQGANPIRQTTVPNLPQVDAQILRSTREFQARTIQQAVNVNEQMAGNTNFFSPGDVRQGGMQPFWLGDTLVLARRVTVNGEDYIQGAWLDWPAVRRWLLDSASDLVPEADLVPVLNSADAEGGRMLATIPARLVPGHVAVDYEEGTSPMLLSLGVAWACVLLAVTAVGVLLLATVTLSERRGAFVSAVTHELRTPLTTFRMYSEMLAGGMVTDAAKRQRYLDTLRTESERLTHLVENVLSYARIERGRARSRVESVKLADLVTRCQGRLGDRARQAGMEFSVEQDAAAADIAVRADASVVEQILFNLVDNACKYAAMADDKRIHLVAGSESGRAVLGVCDHGPGVPESVARRLFRPFAKSAAEAAVTAPGVGLGLALSRRLAREMSGDLAYEPRGADGACFVLRLPLAI